MDMTIGKRISSLRKENGLKQEELAGMLGVSGQAVSKWENDQTCPDISLLPELAKILGVTVDELLSGKQELRPAAQVLPQEQRKQIQDMMLRIFVVSAAGDKVRVNLPMTLVQLAVDTGMELPQLSGNEVLKSLDLQKIVALVGQGLVGDLVEVESADGHTVRVFVE